MTLVDTIANAMARRERDDDMEVFHIDYYRYLAEVAVEEYENYAFRPRTAMHFPEGPVYV